MLLDSDQAEDAVACFDEALALEPNQAEALVKKGAALEKGFFRREIADSAFVYQREIDARRKLIVGVNAFTEAEEKPIDILVVDGKVEKDKVAALKVLKAKRSGTPPMIAVSPAPLMVAKSAFPPITRKGPCEVSLMPAHFTEFSSGAPPTSPVP